MNTQLLFPLRDTVPQFRLGVFRRWEPYAWPVWQAVDQNLRVQCKVRASNCVCAYGNRIMNSTFFFAWESTLISYLSTVVWTETARYDFRSCLEEFTLAIHYLISIYMLLTIWVTMKGSVVKIILLSYRMTGRQVMNGGWSWYDTGNGCMNKTNSNVKKLR